MSILNPDQEQANVETIQLQLSADDAARLYEAVGRQLAKGDVTPANGGNQFGAVLAAVVAGTKVADTQKAIPVNPHIQATSAKMGR